MTRLTIVTLDAVRRGDWIFKVSHCPSSDMICVCAWNEIMLWSNVRFFEDESAAKNWLDYLEITANSGLK